MNLFRGFLFAAAAALVVLAGVAGLALDAHFQTWAAHRVLARRPGLGVSVGSVSFGLDDARLRNVRVERRGTVLTLPEIHAEAPMLPAAFRHAVLIRRLVAKGWTLDLRAFRGRSLAFAAAAVPIEVFQGILDQLKLPVDFALDDLDLEGDVILPAAPGRSGGNAHVMLSGGSLAAGGEGRFVFNVRFVPAGAAAPVNLLVADGTLFAAMDGPRTFRRLALRVDAAATGPKLPRAVRLSADIGAARGPAGETYSLVLAGENRQLASLQVGFPGERRRLAGTWKLDLSDDDLSPFMLGRALPLFYGTGEGRFDADAALTEIRVRGGLNLTADRLGVVRPQLSGIGAVRLTSQFDLTRSGRSLRVDRFKAALAGNQPILTVTGLQAFGFDAGTGELNVADSTRDVLSVALQDVPVAWGQPFLRGIVLTGGSLRGNFTAGARDGGLSLRSSTPLVVANLSAMRDGRHLLQNAGMSLVSSADYTPQGWQVQIKSRAAPPAYGLEARLGRLAGPNQPVKLTARLSVDLPTALAGRDLVSGNLVCDFAADLAAKRAIEVKLAVSDLAAGLTPPGEKLPRITADVRADMDPSGKIIFNAPILISQDGRQSDPTVAGTVEAVPGGVVVDGQITGEKMFLNDAKILAALFLLGGNGVPPPAPGGSGPIRPPSWGGTRGRLTLALKSVVAPQFTADDVTGALLFEPKALRFDGLHASLGDTGDAKISGACVFDATADEPYSLSADLTVGNFDPAPIFRARYPGRMPTVEGKFNISGRIFGRGLTPSDAAADTHGDLSFSSNGGVLRLLTTDISSKGASARKVAIIGFFIGDLANAVTGRKDLGPAIAEVAGRIAAIPYDQMSFVLSRDPSLDTTLRDFALISPEMRLEGGGTVSYEPDTPLLEQPLAAEFKLGARGHTAALIKVVGMLGAHPDDLGYFAFTEPLKIAGTLGKPDTSELQATLLNDVYNRSGASDLIDKLLGK